MVFFVVLIVVPTRQIGWGICPATSVSTFCFSSSRQEQSHLVTRWHPSSLLDELFSVLVNFRSSLRDLIDSGVLPGSSTLNVTQCLLETPQLNLDLALCLLGILQGDLLKALDRLDLLAHIVGLWLEGLVVLLDLVNDLGVLENAPVVTKVNGLRLL